MRPKSPDEVVDGPGVATITSLTIYFIFVVEVGHGVNGKFSHLSTESFGCALDIQWL